MNASTAPAALAATLGALYLAPSATALGQVRRLARLDATSGVGRLDHVALTFDDGPDPASTPLFLRALDQLDVRATFFLLGRMLQKHPTVGRDLVSAGHEVAIHGWDHRPLPLRGPGATFRDISRAKDAVRSICDVQPAFYRPPYGVMSWSAHAAARRLDLTTVLWTTWGRDWRQDAYPESVRRNVVQRLAPGERSCFTTAIARRPLSHGGPPWTRCHRSSPPLGTRAWRWDRCVTTA